MGCVYRCAAVTLSVAHRNSISDPQSNRGTAARLHSSHFSVPHMHRGHAMPKSGRDAMRSGSRCGVVRVAMRCGQGRDAVWSGSRCGAVWSGSRCGVVRVAGSQ
ncbi:hypothetical protein BV898_04473 [Hypsibius exemplaris]|uniref:Uncharacterized protein n=1 Tax=Hypsibius exemplaris TaxID=2072580 RepID=A0A1W0X2B5_HYPEX|nr:hypothetical protein BV898_04473 [Hypsibius exemplaris]